MSPGTVNEILFRVEGSKENSHGYPLSIFSLILLYAPLSGYTFVSASHAADAGWSPIAPMGVGAANELAYTRPLALGQPTDFFFTDRNTGGTTPNTLSGLQFTHPEFDWTTKPLLDPTPTPTNTPTPTACQFNIIPNSVLQNYEANFPAQIRGLNDMQGFFVDNQNVKLGLWNLKTPTINAVRTSFYTPWGAGPVTSIYGRVEFPQGTEDKQIWYELSPGAWIPIRYGSEVATGTPGSTVTVDSKIAVLNTLNILDVATGVVLDKSTPLPTSAFSLAWSRNTDQLSGQSESGFVFVWDAKTLDLLTTFSVSEQMTGNMAYSPYGGVLAIGINPNKLNRTPPTSGQPPQLSQQYTSRLANNSVQIVVPAPSLKKLETIAEQCNLQPPVQKTLTADIQANQLSAVISAVQALSDEDIAPGCAADLLAVANALMSQS